MSRAQTPVNLRRPPLEGIHSTPQSAGSGSNRNYDTQSTRLDYVPYLFQDLRNEKILPFEEFCKTILGLEIDQPKKATTKKLSDLLENYRLPIAKETERYEPFIQLANEVLEACCSEYRFVRNDPKYLWGIDAGRKPDVLLVHKFAWLSRNPILDGPEVPFHPCDIISFHEFKLVQKDLRRYSTLPPTSCEFMQDPTLVLAVTQHVQRSSIRLKPLRQSEKRAHLRAQQRGVFVKAPVLVPLCLLCHARKEAI